MSADTSPNKQEQHVNLEEINAFVDRKIETAKLVILEKRFNYLLSVGAAALAIFGILLPLYLVYQNNERVDKAIERMDNNFKELAGRQLRKPLLTCLVDGNNLENNTITFQGGGQKIIEIKNIGDGTAEYFDYYIYIKNPHDSSLSPYILGYDWHQVEFNDESAFDLKFTQRIRSDIKFPARDLTHIRLLPDFVNQKKFEVQALLKIFYGEPEPKLVPFVIRFVPKDAADK
jgi:hypothetical protein